MDYCASPIWHSCSPSPWLLSNSLTLGCSPSLSREVPWMKSPQSQFQKARCVAWESANTKVIQKVTLSFTPYSLCFHPHPLFQRYLQSNEILLHLSMKCWNSAFKCTTFESNYSSPTGRSSENISISSGGGDQIKGKRGWNSVYHQNWWKTSLGPSYVFFVKFHSQLHIWWPITPKLAILAP